MLNRGVSGAGVVDGDAFDDADAPLLSSLSVSDIRALRDASDFDSLALPVAEFLLQQYGEAMPDAAAAAVGSPAEAVATTVAQVAAMAVDVGGGGGVTATTFAQHTAAAQHLPSAADVAAAMDTPGAQEARTPRLWLVHCSPQATLRQVLDKFVFHGVHRVYIVDERMRPLGVVTMSGALTIY
jgi:hypothetical protein